MMITQLNFESIEVEIKELVQINDIDQPLDSLEITVIKSYLNSLGFEDDSLLAVKENTIKGWMQWLRQHFRNGQI